MLVMKAIKLLFTHQQQIFRVWPGRASTIAIPQHINISSNISGTAGFIKNVFFWSKCLQQNAFQFTFLNLLVTIETLPN